MYLTLDTLSNNDPSITEDKTGEWEIRLEEDSAPKLKFPIRMKDDIIHSEKLEFKDPIIKSPPPKEKKEKESYKVIDMKKKNKTNKNIF